MKIVVAGSRNYPDPGSATGRILLIARGLGAFSAERVEIVSGGARGPDTWAIDFARRSGYPLKNFYANFEELGKKAGPMRNAQMANYADALVAFWDGYSKGTDNMIKQMATAGKPFVVFGPNMIWTKVP